MFLDLPAGAALGKFVIAAANAPKCKLETEEASD
jgi:hypothetical protein